MTEPDVEAIARENRERWAGKSVVAIVSQDGWLEVHEHSPAGVWPSTTYATPHEAIARAMQLLGIKEPVDPQNWPESAKVSP